VPTQTTETRLALVEDHLDRNDQTLASIAETLKALARLEAQNTRIEDKITQRDAEQKQFRADVANSFAALEARLTPIEGDMPDLRRINKAVWGAIQTIGFSLFIAVMGAAGFKILH